MKALSATVIGFAAAISACGGSGGYSNSPPPPVVPTQVVIDSGNAQTVAKLAAGAALESSEFAGMTGALGLSANAQGGAEKPDNAALKIAQTLLGGSPQFIPVGPFTSMCLLSGDVTVSGDVADLLTYTAGDTLSVDSNNCDDGDGQVVDGLLEMTITAFSGDIFSGLFNVGIDMVVTDFSVTEDGMTETANGDMGSTLDTMTPPVSSGSVFGDSFTIAGPDVTESLSNFSTIYTEDISAFPVIWTVDAMGTVDSSDFAGAVTYDTPVIFVGSGENYPSSGELLVTGANNSSLHLITIDNVNVQIDADYDGDTVVDETFNLTWAELEGENL